MDVVNIDTNRQKFMDEFSILVNSGVSVIAIPTKEPYQAVQTVKEYCSSNCHEFHCWNQVDGFRKYSDEDIRNDSDPEPEAGTANPVSAINYMASIDLSDSILNQSKRGIFVMFWPHWAFKFDASFIQVIAHQIYSLSQTPKRLVLVIPQAFTLPPELTDDITRLDFDLPNLEELETIVLHTLETIRAAGKYPTFMENSNNVNLILNSITGMTRLEAENAVARAIVKFKSDLPEVDINKFVKTLQEIKSEIIKRSEILEIMPKGTMEDIGGLDNLKEWISKRSACFSEAAREFGVDSPSGVALIGPPGCLSGSTIMLYKRNGVYKAGDLQCLWEDYESSEKDTVFMLPSYKEDGVIFDNTVISVLFSDKKEVYEIETQGGRHLKLTSDHPVLTSDGFVEAQNLTKHHNLIVQDYENPNISTIDTLIRYRPLGFEFTYDIQMTSPANNFAIANGLIVHNTGKSASAKAIANSLGLNLIRFDVSKVFNSLVGSSEARVRECLKTIDALSPCVVLVDEVDKAFDINSGGGDSGVGMRVLGAILTHMQESKQDIFWVMTANRAKGLPPEMLRKGRLDEIFSVTVPNESERLEILKIHLRKRKQNPESIKNLEEAVIKSEGYVAAELEAAVKEAVVEAFTTKIKISGELIAKQLENMKPLAEAFSESFQEMQSWAEKNARPASKFTETKIKSRSRTRSSRTLSLSDTDIRKSSSNLDN